MPLSSCRLANITASSLSLTCQRPDTPAAGTTHYRAEVYFENRTLFANVTSLSPSFNVSRLDADTSYQIKVYVTHGPVTSQPVVVSAYTSRSLPLHPRGSAPETRGSSVGGVVGGILVAVVIVGGGVWARHYCRRRARRRGPTVGQVEVGGGGKMETRPPSDDSNPDVVPNIAAEETYDLLSLSQAKSDASLYLEQPDTSPHRSVPAQSVQQQLRPHASQSQQQPGLYSSQEVYQPLLMKSSVTELVDSPSGVRTYCQGSHTLDADESMLPLLRPYTDVNSVVTLCHIIFEFGDPPGCMASVII
ncbi:hypothetical protein Pcinc_024703 [Petrolisthes cinctipes]|uniref:Fibronectin type-III domain-containing protein n=1 Tax=Petrolisthes cinctipes TaxID=88211 RepID=A0AAE1KCL6_PETCI|nr:hypothetical protein Pcinc_024703 [Petrolisthes cinctipes]